MWLQIIISLDEDGIMYRTINPRERIFPSKWIDSSVMSYLYTADKKGETFNVLPARILFLTEVFTKPLLLAKMKWFICDVIPDCHLIGRRWNRTINTRELIFRCKWSEYSVMWYIITTDGKHFLSLTKHKVIFRGNYQMEQLVTK